MLPRLAFRLIGAILTASTLSGLLAAQNFDMVGHDRRIVALGGLMRFHPGDERFRRYYWHGHTADLQAGENRANQLLRAFVDTNANRRFGKN